jgi:hypothetical protein
MSAKNQIMSVCLHCQREYSRSPALQRFRYCSLACRDGTPIVPISDGWLAIPGFRRYEAHESGRVRMIRRRDLQGSIGKFGYRHLQLKSDEDKLIGIQMGRAICLAFHGPAPSPEHEAAHGDGNKLNNLPSNLAWKTALENASDKLLHGTLLTGERHPMHKLTAAEVAELRAQHTAVMARNPRSGFFDRAAARLGVSVACVQDVIYRRSWAEDRKVT